MNQIRWPYGSDQRWGAGLPPPPELEVGFQPTDPQRSDRERRNNRSHHWQNTRLLQPCLLLYCPTTRCPDRQPSCTSICFWASRNRYVFNLAVWTHKDLSRKLTTIEVLRNPQCGWSSKRRDKNHYRYITLLHSYRSWKLRMAPGDRV